MTRKYKISEEERKKRAGRYILTANTRLLNSLTDDWKSATDIAKILGRIPHYRVSLSLMSLAEKGQVDCKATPEKYLYKRKDNPAKPS